MYPVLILHSILFPVNMLRLIQFYRLVRDVRDAHREDLPIQSLLPYMTEQISLQGKLSSVREKKRIKLYFLVDGTLEISELGKTIEPGAVLGEIGVLLAIRNALQQSYVALTVGCTHCPKAKPNSSFFKTHRSALP